MNHAEDIQTRQRHSQKSPRFRGKAWLAHINVRWWGGLALSLFFVAPAILPLLLPGYENTIDGAFHIGRLQELQAALAQGQISPRWCDPWAAGLGFPGFVFYGSFPYYLVLSIASSGWTLMESLDTAMALAPLLSATTMYWFMTTLTKAKDRASFLDYLPSVITAIAYSVVPYVAFNNYMRGGFSENLAMAYLPMLMLLIHTLAIRPNMKNLAALAVSLGLLLITHSATSLLAAPLLAGYGLTVAIWKHAKKPNRCTATFRSIGFLAIAAVLGMILASFFWIPAFVEQSYLPWTFEQMRTGYWDPGIRLLDSWPLIQGTLTFDYGDLNRFRLGLLQVLLAIPGLIFIGWHWKDTRNHLAFEDNTCSGPDPSQSSSSTSGIQEQPTFLYGTVGFLWLAFVFIAIVLTPPFADFWRAIPVLNAIQFPWRLFTVAAVCTSVSTGLGIYWLRQKRQIWTWLATLIVIMTIEVSCLTNIPTDTINGSTISQIQINDITTGVKWEANPDGKDPKIEDLDILTSLQLRSFATSPGFVSLDVQTKETTQTALHILDYPGWNVKIDGQAVTTFPLTDRHLLGFNVPPGEHQVIAQFEDTPLRTFSQVISIAGLLILLAIILYSTFRRQPTVFPMAVLLVVGIVIVIPHVTTPKTPHTISYTSNQEPIGDIRLLGASLAKINTEKTTITLCWQAITSLPPKQMHVTLVDDHGLAAGIESRRPFDGTYPTDKWQPGELLFDKMDLSLPQRFDIDNCRLVVGLSDDHPFLVKPDIKFEIPMTPGGQVIKPFTRSSYRIDNFLNLENPAMASSDIMPGTSLMVGLLWQAVGTIPNDTMVFLHLTDNAGKLWAQADAPPGPAEYRALLWTDGEEAAEQRMISVPPDLPPGKYELGLGAYQYPSMTPILTYDTSSDQGKDSVTIGTFYVAPIGTKLQTANPKYTIKANLGEQIELVGYDLSTAELRPGDSVTLTTYWRALKPITTEYTLFTQLLDTQGIVRGQKDGFPASGGLPTSLWQTGEYIVDKRGITIDPSAPPGQLRLIVGFYEWPSLKRLLVEDGSGIGDSVSLTTLFVNQTPAK